MDEGQGFLRYAVIGERHGKWGKTMHFSVLLKIIKLFLTLKTYGFRISESSGLKDMESLHELASSLQISLMGYPVVPVWEKVYLYLFAS